MRRRRWSFVVKRPAFYMLAFWVGLVAAAFTHGRLSDRILMLSFLALMFSLHSEDSERIAELERREIRRER